MNKKQWVTKKNKIMHRSLQWFIVVLVLTAIYVFIYLSLQKPEYQGDLDAPFGDIYWKWEKRISKWESKRWTPKYHEIMDTVAKKSKYNKKYKEALWGLIKICTRIREQGEEEYILGYKVPGEQLLDNVLGEDGIEGGESSDWWHPTNVDKASISDHVHAKELCGCFKESYLDQFSWSDFLYTKWVGYTTHFEFQVLSQAYEDAKPIFKLCNEIGNTVEETHSRDVWEPVELNLGLLMITVVPMLGFLGFLLWTARIRKITSEEKRFKLKSKEIKEEIDGLKRKGIISDIEAIKMGDKINKLYEKFLEDFMANKKRPIEYKIERLSSLKEEGFISEKEFKEAKKQLIEKAG